MKIKYIILLLVLIIFTGCLTASSKDSVHIQGKVTDEEKLPIEGAIIKIIDIKGSDDKKELLGQIFYTNSEGAYWFTAHSTSQWTVDIFKNKHYVKYLDEVTFTISKEGFITETINYKVERGENKWFYPETILKKQIKTEG